MNSKVASEERVDLGRYDERFYAIVGRGDENVRYFSKVFDVRIVPRGTELIVKGEDDKVRKFVSFLKAVMLRLERERLTAKEVRDYAKDFLEKAEGHEDIPEEEEEIILITHRRKAISPKTETQKRYVRAIKDNDVVFGVGPAGTGKTYLAMATALSHLKEQKISKIILTRPAVEAGEKLGFLPGTIAEKVDPYLRPLYDALYDMVDYDKAMYMLERNIIEIAPLAFMRGRTLNDAFIILDEAQNATKEQMKMFLTRIGFGSKVVVTGDITQIDLPKKEHSGLVEALRVLEGVPGIEFVWFSQDDVVRHPIVARIIEAYEVHERDRDKAKEEETQEDVAQEEG
ncbi:PhoH family protein [Hydrogenivirga sp. 128-5-R1-1]|uniref:PhoH family protein n=1 Tax=Hydrogenivirga sp. 128-5-R1-1 TaxID=392423 RepID=UPI00015F15CD|nr:PhoH family protein [Hydrogenivirga sp. 128-5-R1-1]EDP74769.1 phosphate starvation-inducible protein [Hydrogenivirga sp. 128-5-R1-1]